MGRRATGSVQREGDRFYARITVEEGKRRAFRLPTCHDERAAAARTSLLAGWAARLRETGKGGAVLSVVEGASRVTDDQIDTYAALVDRLAGAAHVTVKGKPIAGDVLTFRAFAERWTSGELARDWPDLVATKRTADDDLLRLKKHVFPHVVDLPLVAFTAQHFEAIMRAVPSTAAPATRRHVAQLVLRVIKLAVYPARVLPRSPLEGVRLPRLDRKAKATLYPSEERQLLGATEVPLVNRLVYGFLAREGCRVGEVLGDPRRDRPGLRWRDVDLVRGAVRVVDTKTGEERSWALGKDCARALARWAQHVPDRKSVV